MALNFDDGTWGSAGSMIASVGILEGEVIRRCGSEVNFLFFSFFPYFFGELDSWV